MEVAHKKYDLEVILLYFDFSKDSNRKLKKWTTTFEKDSKNFL